MTPSLDFPLDPPAPEPTATNRRRALRSVPPHHHRPHTFEPVSTARRRPLFSPKNLFLFAVLSGFGLYANGHLPELDRFFDEAQTFGRAHNDIVVHTILTCLPAVLVFTAAGLLALMRFAGRRTRQARIASALDRKMLHTAFSAAAHSPVHPIATVQEPGPQTVSVEESVPGVSQEERAADTSILIQPVKFPVGEWSEQLRGVKPFLVVPLAATVPITPQDQTDAPPTLPATPPIRRRTSRPTLPPAVAAALRKQVAAGMIGR